jgi:hypothetical protein
MHWIRHAFQKSHPTIMIARLLSSEPWSLALPV